MGLVMFRGGTLDSKVYETDTLMSTESVGLPILDYRWTAERVTSARTGAVAQVWVHKSLVEGGQPAPAASAAPAPAQPSAPAPAPTSAVPTAVAGVATPTDETRVDIPSPSPIPAEEVVASPAVETPTVVSGDLGDTTGPGLLARRTNLKLSRKQVSDDTGLAQSKIGGIETGKAQRVKPEEIQRYAAYLSGKEHGAPVSVNA